MERYKNGDTIAALASARGAAGVAVVRISGPLAWEAVQSLMPKFLTATPRQMVYGELLHGHEVVDMAMAVGFNTPTSFTGEDVVEVHTHGSMVVVEKVLTLLCQFPGVRRALAGEFSRRAVLNGKMDLTEAEGVADLIASQTEAQRKQALRLLQGELGTRFEGWRTDILALLAQVEAAIDFPDEELEVLADDGLQLGFKNLMASLNMALEQRAGERVREGVRLAIIGLPNAGKSTLLNVLSGREVAIVSDIAGTTRDVVSMNLELGGYAVTVLDTAGLRDTKDVIEAEGVRRARISAEQADVLVVVVSAAEWPHVDEAILNLMVPERTLVLVSKADLVEGDITSPLLVREDENDDGVSYPVVAANLQDSDALVRVLPVLTALVGSVASGVEAAVGLTRERHRSAVSSALAELGAALIHMAKAQTGGGEEGSVAELVAEDLRAAAAAIGSVTGRTGSEDVLDVVFSTFCVGK